MKKNLLVLLGLLAILNFNIYANGQAEDENVLTVASNCEWPPLEFVDENGDLAGFEIELIQALETVTDYKFEIINTAWDGIFAGLANGAYDFVASGVSVTEERKPKMEFSTPIIEITQSIIAPASSTGLESMEDLNNTTIGVQIGTTGHLVLIDNEDLDAEVKAYDNIALAIEDLINGNLDCVVTDSVVASDYVVLNDNYQGKIKITGVASSETEPIAMAFKKGDLETLKIINDGLAALEANGELAKLKAKWNL
ncbi:MAG: transporter substrate-binding domain-containing protein [Pleomorphochaeta sp.]